MKIEELAEDFDNSVKLESLLQHDVASQKEQQQPEAADLLTQAMNTFSNVSITPKSPSQSDGTMPSLPPAMAALRDKTATEILSELNKSPLFMTSLEENDDLEALKALAYEGTPLEVASGFKERGNECFKEKRWADAKEFYGKGIQVLLLEVRKRQNEGSPSRHEVDGKGIAGEGNYKDEIKQEVAVLEATLVNRAACHLELKNYRSCTLDCASVLRINPQNVKAFYRSSKALLALGRIPEADDACARGLAIDPENKALKSVAQEIVKKNEVISARKKKEAEREQRKKLEAVTLKAALQARGIKVKKTAQPPEMEDAKIALVPDPVDPTSTLTFPTVLLYPLHLESDFLKAFNETETVGHHLDYILPVPWDKSGEYTKLGVQCYMETTTGGLIKVGRKVTLLKVLSSGNIEIVDDVVRIFIVPKQKAEAWVNEFKAKKAAGGAVK